MNRNVPLNNKILRSLLLLAAFTLTCCAPEKNGDNSGSRFADGKKFPAGFVITFDDAYIKDWSAVEPLLDSFKVKATFFIEGANGLTDEQLKLLQILKEEGHEIGVHTERHVNVPEYIDEYGADEFMRLEINSSIERLNKFGITPKSFSYPFGKNNIFTDSLLLKKFTLLRDVTEAQRHWYGKYLTEPKDLDEIYFTGSANVISALGIDVKFEVTKLQLHDALERAKKENSIIVFYAHRPVKEEAKPGSYQISYNYLRYLFSTAEMFGLKSYLFSELISINGKDATTEKENGN